MTRITPPLHIFNVRHLSHRRTINIFHNKRKMATNRLNRLQLFLNPTPYAKREIEKFHRKRAQKSKIRKPRAKLVQIAGRATAARRKTAANVNNQYCQHVRGVTSRFVLGAKNKGWRDDDVEMCRRLNWCGSCAHLAFLRKVVAGGDLGRGGAAPLSCGEGRALTCVSDDDVFEEVRVRHRSWRVADAVHEFARESSSPWSDDAQDVHYAWRTLNHWQRLPSVGELDANEY